MGNRTIQLLDCTLRDGGLALEDAFKNAITHLEFSIEERKKVIDSLLKAKIDIIEMGSIEDSDKDKRGFGIYPDVEKISKELICENNYTNFAALYRGPDIPIEEIPPYRKGLAQIARLIVRYSELEKSIEYCKGLAEKGYRVCIQPMVTERYSDEELEYILQSANKMKAEAVYIVDSYGDLTPKDVTRLYDIYNNELDEEIKIGFHAHNNIEMALMNVYKFIEISEGRNIIIDSCCTGMGQGTGNLQTEVIANCLNKEFGKSYQMESIIEVCSIVDKYNKNRLWGYSTLRFIPAMNNTAYKYAIALEKKYDYSLEEIYTILSGIPDELRYRFCDENLQKLLESRKN